MNNKSPHILTTSSNLLGFTFFVLVSIKGLGLPEPKAIDEFVALVIVILAFSSIFSFASLRTKKEHLTISFETIADYLFLFALILIVILSLLLALDLLVLVK